MKVFFVTFWILSFFSLNSFADAKKVSSSSLFDFSVKDIHGKEVPLSQYRNKVVLVVNTASACGFTPQLKELEEVYKKYSSQGFVVLGFPSNDFNQDKGPNEEIEKFAKDKYQITFPLMDKNPVSGPKKQAVYQFLTDSKSGILFKEVQWNFEKFLIGRDGKVIDRWNSATKPSDEKLNAQIEKALKTK